MMLTILTDSERATREVGRALGTLVRAADVVLLSGDLGAGKTQLTKGLAVGLGVSEPVTSPTFNILLVHEGRIPLYHFDLYRLDRAAQLEDLDYWATLEGDGVSVVEWGDRFGEATPLDGLGVTIRITGDDARRIEVAALGSRGEELGAAWAVAASAVAGAVVQHPARKAETS